MDSISEKILDRDDFIDLMEIMDTSPWTKDLYQELLNLWELCLEKDERALLKDLINRFFILNKQEERKACDKINKYINSIQVDPDTAHIVSVADVGKSDGSLAGLQLLKQKVKSKTGRELGKPIRLSHS